MAPTILSRLAVSAVLLLIAFLVLSSQYLFTSLDSWYTCSSQDHIVFNVMAACLMISYTRVCITHPGSVPALTFNRIEPTASKRFCKKCNTDKPPRAHHCKICGTCVPKMDHHCPWTANCVGFRTFPHFIRFLFYAVGSMVYLESMLVDRIVPIWHQRTIPSVRSCFVKNSFLTWSLTSKCSISDQTPINLHTS